MLEKIDFLIRFWELRARHESSAAPLDQGEQRELLSLLQLVTDDLGVPEARALAASVAGGAGEPCPAHAIGEAGVVSIDVQLVTASSLVVTSARALAVHEAVIVRATDAVAGIEYSLPCRVAWVHGSAPITMALVVDGIPTRAPFDTDDLAHAALARHARPVFGWPRPPREFGTLAARRH
jgi:hypothetical protein